MIVARAPLRMVFCACEALQAGQKAFRSTDATRFSSEERLPSAAFGQFMPETA